MSAIVGERDRLLQAAVPRNLTPRQGKDLSLTADAGSFHISVDGTAAPLFIEFTAHKIDLVGIDSWVASNGATLTGSGLTRRLAYSSMPGTTTTITLTTIEDGQIYVAKVSVGKVRDGATGEKGSAANVTPEALLTSLEGRITKSQLFADLKAEINLITDPVSTPGSVQARVKVEADARVAAITQEASDRTTYVQSYTYSKMQSDESLSVFATTVASAYKSYADGVGGNVLTAAAADVRTYGYSRSTTDAAIAASETRLRSEFVSSGGATQAYVQSWAYSKSQVDQSEALQSSTLTANYQAAANAARDQATATSAADVRNYSYAKSTVDQAFSSQSSTITAAYTSYADAGKAAAIAAAAADIRNYSYSKATVDTAIAQSTASLTTTVGGHTATLQTQTTSINGISTQYTLKSDINGYITGIGFASSANNGNPTSAFIINAGAFAVVAPGAAPRVMFAVGLVNGVAQMVIRGDVLADGAITARILKIGSFDNAVPDPNIDDPAWWGRANQSRAGYQGATTPWKSRRSFFFDANNAAFSDSFSNFWEMTPGATYKIEYQIFISGDFNGVFSPIIHLPGQAWYTAGQPGRGYSFSEGQGGMPVLFDTNSAKGFFTFTDVFVMGNTTIQNRAQARLCIQCTAGYIEFGGLSITRMSDNTLITDQGITTPKLATRAVVADKIESDAIVTRTIKAEAVITDSIISNGITTIDSFPSGINRLWAEPVIYFSVARASKVLITAACRRSGEEDGGFFVAGISPNIAYGEMVVSATGFVACLYELPAGSYYISLRSAAYNNATDITSLQIIKVTR